MQKRRRTAKRKYRKARNAPLATSALSTVKMKCTNVIAVGSTNPGALTVTTMFARF